MRWIGILIHSRYWRQTHHPLFDVLPTGREDFRLSDDNNFNVRDEDEANEFEGFGKHLITEVHS